MKNAVLAIAALTAAALVAPLGAQARSGGHDPVQIGLVTPVNFISGPDCGAVATYGLALHGERGSGSNCILGENPATCPPDVTALFCQNVPVQITLSFSGGSVSVDGAIFEIWNCDATCNVDQRWSGTVTNATRRFHGLAGGSLSGGGLLAFDAVTGDLRAFDETLVLTPPDEG